MSLKTLSLASLFFIAALPIRAQYVLQGIVADNNHQLLTNMHVALSGTTGQVYNAVTGKAGRFAFDKLPQGTYDLKVNGMGYRADSMQLHLLRDTFVTITLTPIPTELKGATITATKPVFEKKIDRFVFNVQNTSLVAGNNVWDVLKQTPLVNAQESGTLSILGLQGVSVYINNRRSILTGRDLQQYLSSLPADNITSIEVITVPSSKYEAGNPGGIINILLKKDETVGLNGSINLADRQATYNTPSGGLQLNYRNRKFGQQLMVNGSSRRAYFYNDNTINYFGNTRQQELIHNQTIKKPENSVGISTSADYTINPSSALGATIDFRTTHSNDYNSGFNEINVPNQKQLYTNTNPETRNTNFLSLNLNYQYLDKKHKREFVASADYFNYQNNQQAEFFSYNKQTPDVVHNGNRADTRQLINNYAIKADYNQLILKNVKMETGVRFSHTRTNSLLAFDNFTNGNWIPNYLRSNDFTYQEWISAAYISFYKKINKQLEIKAGARLEQTNLKNKLATTKESYDQHYLNVFPTAYINYTINDNHSLSFSVKSDIRRPAYAQLNPFIFVISDKYLVKGNPELRPSNSIMMELAYTMHQDYIFMARYTKSTRLFEQIAVVIPPDTTLLDRFNYGNSDNWSLVSVINKSIIKDRWKVSLANTLTLQRQQVDAPQTHIRTSDYLYMCNLSQQFTNIFGSKIDASINGSYFSKMVTANSEISGFGEVGIGFTRNIPAHNLSVSFYAGDIFNTQRLKHFYSINELSLSDMTGFSDSRYIRLSIVKKIGSNKIKTVRKKDPGNSEEANRTR